MPPTELHRRIGELLELMGLSTAADKLVGRYSGGMRRRLDLAMALVHRPRVLFLDEPTEGLDPQSRTALWGQLRTLHADGTAILLTTHYMEEADALSDRICIIDEGRLAAQGRPADLKRRSAATSSGCGWAGMTPRPWPASSARPSSGSQVWRASSASSRPMAALRSTFAGPRTP